MMSISGFANLNKATKAVNMPKETLCLSFNLSTKKP